MNCVSLSQTVSELTVCETLKWLDQSLPVCRSLCRLCGMSLRKAKGPEHDVQGALDESSRLSLRRMGCKAQAWPEVILKVFKVDVTGDMETVHPQTFCHRCWMAAMRGGGFCSFGPTRVPEWRSHTSSCPLCFPKRPSAFQRKGRKRAKALRRAPALAKRVKRDAQSANISVGGKRVLRVLVDQQQQQQQQGSVSRGSKVKPSMQRALWVKNITFCQRDHLSAKLLPDDLPIDFLRAVTCQVCDHLLSDPVQSPCRHLFCRGCIVKYSRVLGTQCPACALPCPQPTDLKGPPKAFMAVLQSLPLVCPREGCGERVRMDSFRAHCLSHFQQRQPEDDVPGPDPDRDMDEYLPVNKGGRPRQHLLSLTRRAQKHRLKELKNQVRAFADKEEGGDIKSVCLTLFLLALRAGNEHKQADELEAMMQGKVSLDLSQDCFLTVNPTKSNLEAV